MGIIKKRRYYFSDSSIASDTVISDVMAGLCILMEIISVIFSIKTKGNIPDIFGTLYICAMILSVVGLIFAYYGFKAQEGGVKSKRISVLLNVLSLMVIVMFVCFGLF